MMQPEADVGSFAAGGRARFIEAQRVVAEIFDDLYFLLRAKPVEAALDVGAVPELRHLVPARWFSLGLRDTHALGRVEDDEQLRDVNALQLGEREGRPQHHAE